MGSRDSCVKMKCDICKESFEPTTGNQIRCGKRCKVIAKAQYDRRRKGLRGIKQEKRYIQASDFKALLDNGELDEYSYLALRLQK
jgi:hypothetical protein